MENRKMRKVIASTFVTLDNLMVGPNEDMRKEISDQQSTVDTLLLGRVTYQMFADYWPTKTTDDEPAADHMNNTPKIVFSKTLENALWGKWNNARVVKDNIAEEIQKLKQQPGKDMAIIGSASIVQTFTNLGLIDEYRLLVHPVILGSGKPLFKNIKDRVNLKLVKTKTFKNGVVVLYYQPDKGESK